MGTALFPGSGYRIPSGAGEPRYRAALTPAENREAEALQKERNRAFQAELERVKAAQKVAAYNAEREAAGLPPLDASAASSSSAPAQPWTPSGPLQMSPKGGVGTDSDAGILEMAAQAAERSVAPASTPSTTIATESALPGRIVQIKTSGRMRAGMPEDSGQFGAGALIPAGRTIPLLTNLSDDTLMAKASSSNPEDRAGFTPSAKLPELDASFADVAKEAPGIQEAWINRFGRQTGIDLTRAQLGQEQAKVGLAEKQAEAFGGQAEESKARAGLTTEAIKKAQRPPEQAVIEDNYPSILARQWMEKNAPPGSLLARVIESKTVDAFLQMYGRTKFRTEQEKADAYNRLEQQVIEKYLQDANEGYAMAMARAGMGLGGGFVPGMMSGYGGVTR